MAYAVPTSIKPMLSKLSDEIPRGDGWLYEPKWDGFRAIVFRDEARLEVVSRDGRPLHRYLPELVPELAESLPSSCVVDGEIVITGPEGLDFDELLLRIHPARSRIELLARTTPASFVAFDLLALEAGALLAEPLVSRRARLEGALGSSGSMPPSRRGTRVLVTPQTDDYDVARDWFDALEDIGLDGVIAKKSDLTYRPGERTMVKVKHVRTADCVVGGYRLSKSKDGIGSLLLGLYLEDELQYVGHTSSFKAPQRRALLDMLRPLEGGSSFGAGRSPGGPSRWNRARPGDWVPLEPRLVCEVAFDKMQGERFRHATRFLRWRPDRDPRTCTFDQLPRRARP